MNLTWELCDLEQTVLATLDDRNDGARVVVGRHSARTAEMPLALDDPAVDLASPGATVLRCKVEGWPEPLFCGRIGQKNIQTGREGDRDVLIRAADPWPHLEKCPLFVGSLGFSPAAFGYKEFTATDQANIMWALIAEVADNGHGIAQGTLPGASVARTLSFPAGSTVAEGVLSVAAMMSGPEFELAPVEESDGTLVEFNAFYPRQGADKSASVIFRLGGGEPGNPDNLIDFVYEPSLGNMVNRHTVIGDTVGVATKGGLEYPLHPGYVASHAASIAAYGVFETSESLGGTTAAAILETAARAVVAANAQPIESFTLSLDPDEGPEIGPGADFWIGDTVAAEVELPNDDLSVAGRVAAASFTEIDSGDVYVDVTCDPSAFSGVTGTGTSVVMDAGEGTVPPPPPEPEVETDPCSQVDVPQSDPCPQKKAAKAKGKGGKGGGKKGKK